MRLVKFLLLALALTLVAVRPASAAQLPASDTEIAAFFDDYVAKSLEEGQVPGGALIVVRDGRVILSKGYGVADLDTRLPLSPRDHLIRQGSISKVVTWLMVMQLADEGKLDLDADVNLYLPFAIDKAKGAITMRHLMTHSAGFTERFMGVYGRPKGPLCETLATTLPARVSRPGTRVSYSNSGAALAACVVERITGMTFEQAAQERVFAPLRMRSATFAQPPAEPLRTRMASHYAASSQRPAGFEYIAIAPAGALNASADDMGLLLAALMRGGAGEQAPVLSANAARRMLGLQQPLAPGLPVGFGLGMIVREHGGRQIVGHGGTTLAAITDMEIVPSLGIGWYIGMTGLGYGGSATYIRAALPQAVIDRFAPAAAPRAFGPSSVAEMAGDWLPARRYRAGPLKMSDLNLIKVIAEPDGSLGISTVTGDDGEMLRWLPQGRDRFVEEKSGTSLVAVRDGSGRIARFASTLVNPVSDIERAPRWLAFAPALLAGSAGLILFAALGTTVAAFIQRVRPRRSVDGDPRDGRWRGAASAALAFLTATLLGWFVLIIIVSDAPFKLTSAELPLRVLGLMAIVSPLASLPLGARATVLLRDARRKRCIAMAALAAAALTCGILFHALGLATVSIAF